MLINYTVSLYRKVYVQNYLFYSLKYLLFRVKRQSHAYTPLVEILKLKLSLSIMAKKFNSLNVIKYMSLHR